MESWKKKCGKRKKFSFTLSLFIDLRINCTPAYTHTHTHIIEHLRIKRKLTTTRKKILKCESTWNTESQKFYFGPSFTLNEWVKERERETLGTLSNLYRYINTNNNGMKKKNLTVYIKEEKEKSFWFNISITLQLDHFYSIK